MRAQKIIYTKIFILMLLTQDAFSYVKLFNFKKATGNNYYLNELIVSSFNTKGHRLSIFDKGNVYVVSRKSKEEDTLVNKSAIDMTITHHYLAILKKDGRITLPKKYNTDRYQNLPGEDKLAFSYPEHLYVGHTTDALFAVNKTEHLETYGDPRYGGALSSIFKEKVRRVASFGGNI